MHRRLLDIRQFLHLLVTRVPRHALGLLRSGSDDRRSYLKGRATALRHHVHTLLGIRVAPPTSENTENETTINATLANEYYVQIHAAYRPPRLPIEAHLFCPPGNADNGLKLWRFYARHGVILHPLFQDHIDFFQPENAPLLAKHLEAIFHDIEHQHKS
jgi:hypothetical protein